MDNVFISLKNEERYKHPLFDLRTIDLQKDKFIENIGRLNTFEGCSRFPLFTVIRYKLVTNKPLSSKKNVSIFLCSNSGFAKGTYRTSYNIPTLKSMI